MPAGKLRRIDVIPIPKAPRAIELRQVAVAPEGVCARRALRTAWIDRSPQARSHQVMTKDGSNPLRVQPPSLICSSSASRRMWWLGRPKRTSVQRGGPGASHGVTSMGEKDRIPKPSPPASRIAGRHRRGTPKEASSIATAHVQPIQRNEAMLNTAPSSHAAWTTTRRCWSESGCTSVEYAPVVSRGAGVRRRSARTRSRLGVSGSGCPARRAVPIKKPRNGAYRDRTGNLCLAKASLSQLS
jgi:hypothetical protein